LLEKPDVCFSMPKPAPHRSRRNVRNSAKLFAGFEPLERRQMMSVVPVAPPAGSVKLTGTLVGTSGSYKNQGNTIANAIDGNPSTFFDAPSGTAGWVGLDLGTPETVTQVQFVPRNSFASRMLGGVIQGSTTPDFSSGVTNLYSITKTPAANVFTAVAISNTTPFEYVRYLAPVNGSGNIAELEFDGQAVTKVLQPTVSTASAKADAPTDVLVTWQYVGATPATSYTVLRYTGTNPTAAVLTTTADGTTTSYDDSSTAAGTTYTYVIVPNNGSAALAAITAAAVTTPAISLVPIALTGTPIGTGGSYRSQGNTITNVFDGNYNTFFDAPAASGSWVGLDLGSPQAITQIQYVPRGGFSSRMVGGVFQASNTADFSSDVVTLFTVTASPAGNIFTTQAVTTNGGFRYVRYLSPVNGSCNVAEIRFTGLPSAVVPMSPSFPSTITWTSGANSPIVRAEAVGGAVNGLIYAFGGFDNEGSDTTTIPLQSECDVYNPATNVWTKITSFPEPFTHSQDVIVGNDIWFVGGYIGNHPGPGTTHVWIYDTVADSWTRGPDLPQARGAGAAALVGDTIYFTGGMDETRTIDENTTYALNLDNPSAGWVQEADLPNGRNHVAAASLGGYFYVIGGQHGQEDGQAAQSEVDRYDPSTNTWTQMASLPTDAGKSHITEGTLVYDGRIVVIGGETGYNDPQQYIVDYDPVSNTWNQLGLLPAARSTVIAGFANGQLIVTTGNSPSATNTTWIGTLS
jgi:hypothetical protein